MTSKTRKPIVKSWQEYRLPLENLKAIAEGFSVIEAANLPAFKKKDWQALLISYGFTPDDPAVKHLIQDIRDQSHAYIEKLLLPIGKIGNIPPLLLKKNLFDLLQFASQKGPYQKWACSLLRVYHAHVHALFFYDLGIQNLAFQELQNRINRYVTSESKQGNEQLWLGDESCRLPLVKIQYKDKKTVSSIVTKILHKPANMAHQIYDRIGVRLVVPDTLTAALLLNFLHSRHVLPFFHLLPGQSENSLLDWNLLQKKLKKKASQKYFDQLHQKLHDSQFKAASTADKRTNPHTHETYRSIQFTSRLLIQTAIKPIKFHFYPFEVQIFDTKAWRVATTGAAAHHRYRLNQLKAVRRRVFPWLFFSEQT